MPSRLPARALAAALTTSSLTLFAATTADASVPAPGWAGTACGALQPVPLAGAADLSDAGLVGGHADPFVAATWNRWTGTVDLLGDLGGDAPPSQVTALSVSGRIAGTASIGSDPLGPAKAVRVDGSLPQAVLDPASDEEHLVAAVNDRSTVVGGARVPGGPLRAFRWRAEGEALAAPDPRYRDLVAVDVNEDDWVLGRGERTEADGARVRAVLWSPEGSPHELPEVFPRVALEPVHLDEAGQVTVALRIDGVPANGFGVWTGSRYDLVPGPEADGHVEVVDADDDGDVVGIWTGADGERRPFLFAAGTGWLRLPGDVAGEAVSPSRVSNVDDVLVHAGGRAHLWSPCSGPAT